MVLSGTVYRLASSMSDHTPVLFSVFEDWNEESVVAHISFVPFVIKVSVINYWLLNARFDLYSVRPSWNVLHSIYGLFNSRFNLNRNTRFDSNTNGRFAGPSIYVQSRLCK